MAAKLFGRDDIITVESPLEERMVILGGHVVERVRNI
jgi:hypothetical protein